MVGPGNKIYPEPLFALTGGFYSELFRSWDVTRALTAGGGGRADISYFSMSAVGIFRIGLAARRLRLDDPTKDSSAGLKDRPPDFSAPLALVSGVLRSHEIVLAQRSLDSQRVLCDIRGQ